MTHTPAVSVIVPAYNAARTVEECVHSVLAQTYTSFEILVIDDGSTDDTASIVGRMEDERVQLLCQPNAGVATARNAGIAASRGSLIAPLDADDIWYPGKLAAQVARMRRGGEAMGMVYSWWTAIDEASVVRGTSSRCRAEGHLALCLFYANFLGNASVPLYRRSIVERVGGYDPELRARGAQGCEDWDLSLRVAACSEVGVAPGHFTGYRRAAGSMSGDVAAMARSYNAIVQWVRANWKDVPPEVYRWSRANFASYLASQCQRAGQYGEAARWTAEALRNDSALLLSRPTYRALALALASAAGADRLIGAVRQRRAHPLAPAPLARDEKDRVGAPCASPWDDSTRLYDRVRARRWREICAVGPAALHANALPDWVPEPADAPALAC